MRTILLVSLLIVFSSTAAFAANDDGRYQFGATDMPKVIDTRTGAIWIARSDGRGNYIFVPVPYKSPDGKPPKLTPPKSN